MYNLNEVLAMIGLSVYAGWLIGILTVFSASFGRQIEVKWAKGKDGQWRVK